jgi:hypothetical protein
MKKQHYRKKYNVRTRGGRVASKPKDGFSKLLNIPTKREHQPKGIMKFTIEQYYSTAFCLPA